MKKGFTMLIVIIFMVISQGFYWGLIGINYYQSKRIIQFQVYLQSRIQELIAESVFWKMYSESLDSELYNQVVQSSRDNDPSQIKEWIHQEAQWGLASLVSSKEYERMYLYQTQLYLHEDYQSKLAPFQNTSLTGYINRDNQLMTECESLVRWEHIEEDYQMVYQTLLDQGYRPVYHTYGKATHPRKFKQNIHYQFIFNQGMLHYSNSYQTLHTISFLPQMNFQRKSWQDSLNFDYLIKYQGILFEKEVKASLEGSNSR